ncbi:MAG: alpha-amylase [Candidatus Riflebacteria bacterium]|nr:alpha-amylase [Candidatus Riflebacteria bacterium]
MSFDLLKGRGIRLYNLFPRIVGNMIKWKQHYPRVRNMGFNAIYVNPFHYPGFSGSLYSPKDYYKFNPLFIDDSSPLSPGAQLKDSIEACHHEGLVFIMDLVINHTAIDCTLIQEHPNWYLWKEGKIMHPGAWDDGKWVEWGDLAEINNEHSSDRENLWKFWWKMMSHYLEMGVDGFRCDAAYKVPAELWRYLINQSRDKKPGCLFLAESLGCAFEKVEELANVGFDYLFNSSKFWDFNQPWGMQQYNKISPIVSTISFPESHDTPRLLEELQGDMGTLKRQFLFSTLFSKGVMIPTGFEFGFRKSLNVVETMPNSWESTNTDLTEFIKSVLNLKNSYEVLNMEKGLSIVDQDNWYNVLCFKRSSEGKKTVLVMINKDKAHHQRIFFPDLLKILGSGKLIDVSPEYHMENVPQRFEYGLRPAQVKILTIA